MRQPRSVTATFTGDHLKVQFTGTHYPDDQGQDYTDNIEVDSIEVMDVDIPKASWPKTLEANLLGLAWDLEFS